jgi:hypothetical protein
MTSTINELISTKARGATLATALLLTSASASTAKAATVSVSSTCTFAKAVKTLNVRSNQTPCTHSGPWGTDDTVARSTT